MHVNAPIDIQISIQAVSSEREGERADLIYQCQLQ